MSNRHISKHSLASSSLEGRSKAAIDYRYPHMARIWAEDSYCRRRQVGALVVKDKMVINDGHNGTPSDFENICGDESGVTKPYALRAEANATTKLARSDSNSKDPTLYITTSPCIECAKLIIQASIRRVVYAEKCRLTGGIDLLTRAGVEVGYISPGGDNSSSSASLQTRIRI